MFYSFVFFFIYSFFGVLSQSANIIEIDISSNWTIQNLNGSIEISNLTIPINVHHALEDASLINNPLYSYNDVELRWIANEPLWTFRKYINITQDIFKLVANDAVTVQFEFFQLDTIASIYLNDQFLMFTKNQFVKHVIQNFNSKLVNGMNKLEIQFKSPIMYANELNSLYPYRVYLQINLYQLLN